MKHARLPEEVSNFRGELPFASTLLIFTRINDKPELIQATELQIASTPQTPQTHAFPGYEAINIPTWLSWISIEWIIILRFPLRSKLTNLRINS